MVTLQETLETCIWLLKVKGDEIRRLTGHHKHPSTHTLSLQRSPDLTSTAVVHSQVLVMVMIKGLTAGVTENLEKRLSWLILWAL